MGCYKMTAVFGQEGLEDFINKANKQNLEIVAVSERGGVMGGIFTIIYREN